MATRHGDHDALLEPARELVGIGVEALARGPGCAPGRRARRCGARASCCRHALVQPDRLDHLRARRSAPGSGSSSAPGRSWPRRRRALRRISATDRPSTSRPQSSIEPASMRPGLGTRRRIESAVIDLPQPDSPTSASTSPGRDLEAHAVHDGNAPLGAGEAWSPGRASRRTGSLTGSPAACADRGCRARRRRRSSPPGSARRAPSRPPPGSTR